MRIAIIILAAGSSHRFGPENKLLAGVGGESLVVHVARNMAAVRLPGARIEVRAVVTGAVDPVALALAALPADVRPLSIENPRSHTGMASSIAAGIASLPPDTAAALIVPGDMPLLTASPVERLLAAFIADGGVRPAHPQRPDGTIAGPVVWPRSRFSGLMALQGDNGGRKLLSNAPRVAVSLDAAELAALADIDTPADLARLAAIVGRPCSIAERKE